MKNVLFILSLIFALTVKAQIPETFDGRWCSLGSSTLVFSAKNNKLYCTLVEEHKTKEFASFYLSQQLSDSAKYFEVNVSTANSKIFLGTTIHTRRDSSTMLFVYDRSVDTTLYFVGDVYYDSTRMAYTNSNCNMDVPACSSYFYKKNDYAYLSKLKSLTTISRKEAFEVLRRFMALSATKCNRCYEGFPGAYMNRIIIGMGYNPVYQQEFDGELCFKTSGLDFIVDTFIGRTDKPNDKEMADYLKNKYAEYFFGKKVPKSAK